ncbi:GNAT family N-acetyltransferase [Psychrobacillus lasiicapitis]|uniref:GNAT family N-acetyltransferase n=1 Tax=Psychrobacillus lasiicapitis TaxID=1636719 RepID=A0A544T1G5_9BACI|nr:GNAT family N-acetyltransferase [Psychrobacillus lasiicapitis]TQR11289.1 GNAT family N-acetyltransferase [Psychrobacillus lasiicapitis]GGA41762.1 putative N-acetyltransferase YkwB [Psychrobacillus lasiicapitis]
MYRKELFVFQEGRPIRAIVRNYKKEDFKDLIAIQQECFPPPFPSELWWSEEQLTNHVKLYPEGALCVEINGELVGSITGLLVPFDPENPIHTWEEVTDHGYIRNHDPKEKTLYIVDISVKPAFRKLDLGKLLMQAVYERVVHDDLDRVLGGGRMPGYHHYATQMTPQQYVENVLVGNLKDPVISFLLRCGRTPVCVVPDYLEDEESHNNALLMEWKNPFK